MAYSPWSHEELGETERLEREKEREREMPLLGPGACGQPRASSWTAVSEASSILSSCFCVGGSALLPGEFKPDGQRIPGEI